MIARASLLAILVLASVQVACADLKVERLTLEAWFINPAGKPVPVRLPVAPGGRSTIWQCAAGSRRRRRRSCA